MSSYVEKNEAREISAEIRAAVELILKNHNMEITKMNSKYGEGYQIKFEVTRVELNEDGINLASPEAQMYKSFGSSYGLRPELLGTRFTLKGKEYRFAGVSTSRVKYCIYTLDNDNKTVLFTTQIVDTIHSAADSREGVAS